MSSEHLASEFTISTVLDSIDFESMGVKVSEVLFCEHVTDRVEDTCDCEDLANNNFYIRDLCCGNVVEIFGDIVSHLRS
jgi:hypothetical protein